MNTSTYRNRRDSIVVFGRGERLAASVPRGTVMVVTRNDLPLAELARRHRGKRGRENAFKGPLRDMGLHDPPCRGYRATLHCSARTRVKPQSHRCRASNPQLRNRPEGMSTRR